MIKAPAVHMASSLDEIYTKYFLIAFLGVDSTTARS